MGERLLDFIARGYVINLPARKDRLEDVTVDLASAGMPIDGQRIRVFPGIAPADPGSFQSRGIRGCFMSHLGVLKEALADKLPNVMVMEDDWQHTPQFKRDEQHVVQLLRTQPWDIAFLGHAEMADEPKSKAGAPTKLIEWPSDRRVIGAHAYLVNGSTIPRLVEMLETILTRPFGDPRGGPMPLDGAISTFRQQNPEVRTLLAVPSLIGQRSSASDITPRWWDRHPMMRPIGRLVRKCVG